MPGPRWIATLLVLAGAAPLLGHTKLVTSEPADGARLEAPPTQLVLRFETRVQPHFATVEVTGPDGGSSRSAEPVAIEEEGRVLKAPLEEGLAPGIHEVRWAVVSADGHRLEGRLSFTVAPAPTPGAGGAPPQ